MTINFHYKYLRQPCSGDHIRTDRPTLSRSRPRRRWQMEDSGRISPLSLRSFLLHLAASFVSLLIVWRPSLLGCLILSGSAVAPSTSNDSIHLQCGTASCPSISNGTHPLCRTATEQWNVRSSNLLNYYYYYCVRHDNITSLFFKEERNKWTCNKNTNQLLCATHTI